MSRSRTAKERNKRLWYEYGDAAVLDTSETSKRGLIPVWIRGVHDSGKSIVYDVEEVASAAHYPAAAEQLRPPKDAAEMEALIEERRRRGETRGGKLPEGVGPC